MYGSSGCSISYTRILCTRPCGYTYPVHKMDAGAKRPGRFSLEGGYEDAPGLYMGNCSAHNNPGTYPKRRSSSRRQAHGWTLSGKRSAGGGWGAVWAHDGPPSASGLRATKAPTDGAHAFACNGGRNAVKPASDYSYRTHPAPRFPYQRRMQAKWCVRLYL
jgi:hypothetical protein